MKNKRLIRAWSSLDPDQQARQRMLDHILTQSAQSPAAPRKEHKMKTVRRILICAALIAVLSATAFAIRQYTLRDLVIQSPTAGDFIPQSVYDADTSGSLPDPSQTQDMISLQGWAGSPENLACAEWQQFLSTYDQDGSILAQVGNSFNEYSEVYPAYLCYSKEMADKLEEILDKYDLQPHEESVDVVSWTWDEICALAGIGNFTISPSPDSGLVNLAYPM